MVNLFLLKQTANSNTVSDDQYSNLNLNQNYKCPTLIPVQSSFKSKDDKAFGDSEAEEKHRNKSFHPDLRSKCLPLNYDAEKEDEKRWKNESPVNSINKSTLSLHIAAFENIMEDAASDLFGGKNGGGFEKEKCGTNKKWKNANQIFDAASTFDIRNPFEFPRQQDDKVPDPAVSQFTASQRLLNPNEATKNGQQENGKENDGEESGMNIMQFDIPTMAKQCGIELTDERRDEILDEFRSNIENQYLARGTPRIGDSVEGYEVHGYLGIGGFGIVCLVSKYGLYFALKAMPATYGDPPSKKEFTYLQKSLFSNRSNECLTGLEWIKWMNKDITVWCMVMKLCGKSLSALKRDKEMDAKRGLVLIKEALQSVELLHSLHFVHFDIKLDNFSTDIGDQNKIYLIDYGMVKPAPKKDASGIRFIGTQLYGSRRALEGFVQTYRDDAESWCNCLLEIYLGQLPWRRADDMAQAMVEFWDEPNAALPKQITQIMAHIQNLQFHETMNFNYVRYLIQEIIEEKQFVPYFYARANGGGKNIISGNYHFNMSHVRAIGNDTIRFVCRKAKCGCSIYVKKSDFDKAAVGAEAVIVNMTGQHTC